MSIKILLADDSITIQKVIGIIFGGEDYSLTVVDNGKAAIEKARESAPDVLLIDALMPGMSGYEVCEAVRAVPELATKPILLLTGSFEPFDEEKAKQCGADDFISKPFESQQIVNKVKELHSMGSTRTAPAAPAVAPPSAEPAPAAPVFEPAPTAPPVTPSAPVLPEAPPVTEVFETSATPDDIWGAFTAPAEPEPAAAPVATAPVFEEPAAVAAFEPDVFAIVSEETEAQVVTSEQAAAHIETTGSQWIPVEEQTFELGDTISASAFDKPAQTTEETAFGEISFAEVGFEEPAAEPTQPTAPPVIEPTLEAAFEVPPSSFEEPAVSVEAASTFDVQEIAGLAPEQPAGDFAFVEAPFTEEPVTPAFEAPPAAAVPLAEPVAAPIQEPVASLQQPQAQVEPASAAAEAAAPAPVLSEEQLKAALASVSKDVIERIVWEVVPDLAEALIRDAICKIKEGV